MNYDKKETVVAGWYFATKPIEQWRPLHDYLDVGGPLAYLVGFGFIDGEASESGREAVEEAYKVIMESLELDPNLEFDSWYEVNDYVIEHGGKSIEV